MSSAAPVLLRRRYVCDYEAGPRDVPPPSRALSLGAPVLAPVTSLACVVTHDRVVALTYDDGPQPGTTPGILDALAEARVRATFFVLVERAERHPDIIARMIAEGHEVGLHGLDHQRLTTMPSWRAARTVAAARRRLEAVTGVPVRWFRPAYGAITAPLALAVRASGLDVVLWTAWSQDWNDDTAEEIADRAVAASHHGGILLMHDAFSDESDLPAPRFDRGEATRRMLAGLRDAGWRGTSVGEVLAAGPQGRTVWFETRREGRARAAAASGAPV